MRVDLESSHFISVICKFGLCRVSCISWTNYCFSLFLVCLLQFLNFVFSLRKSVFSLTCCSIMGLSTELCIWFTGFSISSVSNVIFIQYFCLGWISLSYLAIPSLFHPAVCILNQELIFFFEHTHVYICVYHHSFEFLSVTSSFSPDAIAAVLVVFGIVIFSYFFFLNITEVESIHLLLVLRLVCFFRISNTHFHWSIWLYVAELSVEFRK